jgi:DNA-binding NarL/FixJ family response regulator
MAPTRIAIVEDNEAFRRSLADAIAADDGFELVGLAADVRAGGELLLRQRPAMLLVDLDLPDGNGLDVIRLAHQQVPECDVMVVTVFGDERHVLDSIEAGATGYLLKTCMPADLVSQLRALREGGSPISPVIARRLLARLGAPREAPPADDGPGLSQREVLVLQYAAKGFNYDEIAQLIGVSRNTVLTYVKRSYRKLQVNSKIEALHEARQLGLLHD